MHRATSTPPRDRPRHRRRGHRGRLLDLIGQLPTSGFFRHRPAWPLELWWLALGLVGVANSTWPLVAAGLGDSATRWRPSSGSTRPPLRGAARGRSGAYPLVVPSDLPDGTTVADLLASLAGTAQSNPALFANTALLEQTLPIGADSLLLRLAVRSLQVAIGDIGRAKAGQGRALPEPIVRPTGGVGRLQGWIGAVTSADVDLRDARGAAAGRRDRRPHRARRGRPRPAGAAADRDGGLLGVPHRPVAGRPTDATAGRAADRGPRRAGTRRIRLGGRAPPGGARPDSGRAAARPVPGQALTAAVLRDRAVNDPSATRWDMDLTSRTVRGADGLAEQVRTGAHLGEAVGREVERVVAVRADVDRLRARFPLRTEHAGRRVCDGLAVLAADPTTLGLDPPRLAGLDDLRAALDAYGDLLVAEAVHHVAEGRPDMAGAVMDAAAGLARPPELRLLQTTRSGRTLASSVVLALPDTAATDPDSPAELADPATAAFLHAQLGTASEWTFGSVTLADLGLLPADALALSLTDLTRLAGSAEGTGPDRYEQAQRLVGLIGRRPATRTCWPTPPTLPTPPTRRRSSPNWRSATRRSARL